MIVELVGLPGSGKSTFARMLESDAGFTRVRVRGPLEILAYNAIFCIAHPIRFARLLLWTLAHLGPAGFRYEKFVNCFLVHNAKFAKARRFPHAIIDQGHHQNFISLFDKALSAEDIEAYRALLPAPDVLVLFDVSRSERERGIVARGHGVRAAQSDAERAVWEAAAEKNFGSLARRVSEGDLPHTVIRVDETRRSSEAITRIVATLARPIVRYVMNVRMPTEKAHGVQIYRSLEALSELGVPAELWIPRRTNPITESVDAYYASGLARDPDALFEHVAIRRFAILDAIAFLGWAGPLAHWISEALFAFALLCTRTDRNAIYYTRSAVIARLLSAKRLRVVYEAHIWPASRSRIFSWFIRGAELIVANSEGTAAAYRNAGFLNVHCAPNGVLLAGDRSESASVARAALGIPERRTVLYLGAFYHWKGAPFLADMWARYFSERSDVQLVMVGGDPDKLLAEGASDAAVSALNLIVVAHQRVQAVPRYLRAADVLVLPLIPATEEARTYTSPIKLFEYLSSGRPIIAADLPSVRSVLSSDIATFFPPGDASVLAEKIRTIFTPEGEARTQSELRARAASGILELHTWKARMSGIARKLDIAL